jgi:SagB-type dehydrogenase family enzyme
MDWDNQPDVFKAYDRGEFVKLPDPAPFAADDLWHVSGGQQKRDPSNEMDLMGLSRIFSQAAGLTARVRYPGKDHFYRSVPSAGALYPTELYLANRDVNGLDPGLYHYGIRNRSLTQLRQADLSSLMSGFSRTGEGSSILASFFITGIFFRSAWKYRDRAYRYVLLDAGHQLENLALALKAEGFLIESEYVFDDDKLDHLLGLDGQREVSLACVHVLGRKRPLSATAAPLQALPEEMIQKSRVANEERAYDGTLALHTLGKSNALANGRDPGAPPFAGMDAAAWVPILTVKPEGPVPGFSETVFHRRSKRNFMNQEMPGASLHALLELLCRVFDEMPEKGNAARPPLYAGFLSGRTTDLAPGFYIIDPFQRKYGLVKAGDYMGDMAAVCLDQAWLKNASLHFLFMLDLEAVYRLWGPRGYRYGMFTAGRLGHMVNLGAQALGLGSCGIGALYDGEARALLGLLSTDVHLVYLVAAGPVKRL